MAPHADRHMCITHASTLHPLSVDACVLGQSRTAWQQRHAPVFFHTHYCHRPLRPLQLQNLQHSSITMRDTQCNEDSDSYCILHIAAGEHSTTQKPILLHQALSGTARKDSVSCGAQHPAGPLQLNPASQVRDQTTPKNELSYEHET